MKEFIQFLNDKPAYLLMGLVAFLCVPGIIVGVFNVGQEVGRVLSTLF